MTFEKLKEKIELWSKERNLDKAEPTKQMLKLLEETGELASGIARSDNEVIIDSLGDVLVVLIILSQQLDLDLVECLQAAHNEIKDRQGKTVNGVFVKKEDFKVGDKARPLPPKGEWHQEHQYLDDMKRYVGEVGVVEEIDNRGWLLVAFDRDFWYYKPEWLEKV